MRSKSLWFFSMTVLWSCAALADVQPSRPQKATIYRDGYAILEEALQLADPERAVLRLPAGTDPASVCLLSGEQRIDGLELVELLEEKEQKQQIRVHGSQLVDLVQKEKQRSAYELRLRDAKQLAGKRLVLRYGSAGLVWQPQLDLDVTGGERASIALSAVVSNQALDLHDCQIQLASGAGALSGRLYFSSASFYSRHAASPDVSRAADVIYAGGRHTIAKDSSAVLRLMAAASSYEQKYLWHTDTRNRIQTLLVIRNPFPQALCASPASLYRQGALVSQDVTEWAPAGSSLMLAAGSAAGFELERSIDTRENLADKARPFRHVVAFTVRNRELSRARVEVIMPKKVGHRHKTLYSFKRKPDRRPGAYYIWELDLAKGEKKTISFHFDSEHSRFSGYESYEKASYSFL
ncbi:MAG: hypothetical protein JXR96_16660 [Deltaproteobacteria bacterium]|nr:hypothetical protein [Deltaproteobacteria bacterium]